MCFFRFGNEKTKVVKTLHGHNGGHDCLPCALAFSLLAGDICWMTFFLGATHWNPSLSVTMASIREILHLPSLEMICKFLVFQGNFFQISLMSFFCLRGGLTQIGHEFFKFSSGQSYLHALEQYPSKSAHQKLVKLQKRETAELRDMLDRVAVRKGLLGFEHLAQGLILSTIFWNTHTYIYIFIFIGAHTYIIIFLYVYTHIFL